MTVAAAPALLAVRNTPATKPSAARAICGVSTPVPGWLALATAVLRLTVSTA